MAQFGTDIAKPYFELLGKKTIKKNLRILLIKESPEEFYLIITNTAEHILNGTFCRKNKIFCKKYIYSLYLLALPTTKLKDLQKVLISEPYIFIKEIYTALLEALKE